MQNTIDMETLKLRGDFIEYRHTELGQSTRVIAEELAMKKNTVLVLLRNRGVLRKALGRDIEERVARWLGAKGKNVTRQRGDESFDLMVDGRRVDVKSANLVKNGIGYYFQTQCLKNRVAPKDLLSEVDEFYLVFCDVTGMPIARLESSHCTCMTMIYIRPDLSTNLPIQWIGYLDR